MGIVDGIWHVVDVLGKVGTEGLVLLERVIHNLDVDGKPKDPKVPVAEKTLQATRPLLDVFASDGTHPNRLSSIRSNSISSPPHQLIFADPGETIVELHRQLDNMADLLTLNVNPRTGQMRALAVPTASLPQDLELFLGALMMTIDGQMVTALDYIQSYTDEVIFTPVLLGHVDEMGPQDPIEKLAGTVYYQKDRQDEPVLRPGRRTLFLNNAYQMEQDPHAFTERPLAYLAAQLVHETGHREVLAKILTGTLPVDILNQSPLNELFASRRERQALEALKLLATHTQDTDLSSELDTEIETLDGHIATYTQHPQSSTVPAMAGAKLNIEAVASLRPPSAPITVRRKTGRTRASLNFGPSRDGKAPSGRFNLIR